MAMLDSVLVLVLLLNFIALGASRLRAALTLENATRVLNEHGAGVSLR